MSVLVTLAQFKEHLGPSATTAGDPLLQALLDHVEAVFESECGRDAGAFRDAADDRTEVLDGTGSAEIFLEYPIDALTSVKLGYDSSAPDETLDVDDKTVLVFGVGSRRVTRTDGGVFGRVGQPRCIEVVYDHGADLPANAALAIKSVAAIAYRRRGSEEASSETLGAVVDRDLIAALATEDPFWQMAVNANRRLAIA